MAKSPGFWFFTGDWLKDPELRFCSIFARGLLVDLLCFCFESQEQGFLSNPDGTPRTDRQIVDAVSGGDAPEKLAALTELEKSGVLSRDLRGVLYSRRISRLAELSEHRKQSGSKGGSKTQAKLKQSIEQNGKQRGKQKRGVSDSDSDSVSTKEIPLPPSLDTQEFRSALTDWLATHSKYKPAGLKAMITRAENRAKTHGVAMVCQAIAKALANGWKGWDQDSSFPLEKAKPASRCPTAEDLANWNPT